METASLLLSFNMLGKVGATVAAISVLFCVVAVPVFKYFHDPKGLRRYPNLDLLAGITNLSFMIEAHKGFRSKRLLELHSKGIPVIRIGPNSLSYGEVRAIKVGFCSKQALYVSLVPYADRWLHRIFMVIVPQ